MNGREGNALEAIVQAEHDLEVDEAIRERVRARVKFLQRQINDIDWGSQPWGTENNTVIAKRLNIPTNTVGYHRPKNMPSPWVIARAKKKQIDWSEVGLGVLKDKDVAEKTGIPQSSVTLMRVKMKVPCFKDRFKRFDWLKAQIGKLPDSHLAEQLGCSPVTVFNARKRLGIPAWTWAGTRLIRECDKCQKRFTSKRSRGAERASSCFCCGDFFCWRRKSFFNAWRFLDAR